MVSGAVQLREPSPRKLILLGNTLSLLFLGLLFLIAYFRARGLAFFSLTGTVLAILSFLPHELLHAVCFKEDVYLFLYLKGGMMFVVGSEDFGKWRFVLMSLLPNIILGIIPYIIFLFNPVYGAMGTFGAMALAMGVGDYLNVYNALTQVPENGKVFMYQMSTFLYQ